MDQVYCLETLFEQLGLPADKASMDQFVKANQLPNDVKLTEAEFWSCNQKEFLIQGFKQDAEWTHVIDELNVLLHESA